MGTAMIGSTPQSIFRCPATYSIRRAMKRALISALFLSLLLPCAQAAVFKDETLQRLYEQGKFDDLEREAKQRSGSDAMAAFALAQAVGNDKAALDAAIGLAERCVQQHPQAAPCHFALGSVMGLKAQVGGTFAGLRLVGRIKDSLAKAVELDPQMFEARSALQMVYLVVPGVAGGSVEKAKALESSIRETQPEVAKLLRARVAAQDDRWEEAERELNSVRLGEQRSFHNEVVNAWSGLARQWMKEKNPGKARAVLERLSQQLPLLAAPVYSLARIAGQVGRHEEAIKLYERSRALSGASSLPIDYRMAVAYMDLVDKDKARALLQRFVQDKRSNPSNLQDARKRLKELG